MNRSELVELIAARHTIPKAQANRLLETVLDAIVASVKKNEPVQLIGFGSFKQVSRAARTGRNPRDGSPLKLPAAKLPKFTAGAAFKAAVDTKPTKRKSAAK